MTVVLCILDGWGLRAEREANAVALAHTPEFDALAAGNMARLTAHGPAVGLPEGQMGNSEVGHTTIGAGRIVWMDLPRIDRAIADGSFAASPVLARFAAGGGTAHIAGLASPGGVHAHQRHILAAAQALTAAGRPVALHLFTDGRDVAPQSARAQLAELVAALPEGARVASLMGRFYAMDRDSRWDRTEAAWRAIRGDAPRAESADAAIAAAYAAGVTDEFVEPVAIEPAPPGPEDGLFFANFRADRARQILAALLDPGFGGFATGGPSFGRALGMVRYSDALAPLMDVMFPPEAIPDTLGAVVAQAGKSQLRLAETEKFPHVTSFLNGGREAPEPGEQRHMAPSPKVKTYDLAPEMAAAEVAEALVRGIEAGTDLIVVNFANPDMVGHSGDLAAAIAACEAVDRALGRAVAAVRAAGAAMIVTADHGNAETMVDADGEPHTAHTLNPVPAILVGRPGRLADGGLSDLAPTLLELMGLARPAAMEGTSLWRR